MPWLKVGDTAPTNPIVAEVLEHPAADDRSKLELFGFVGLCATVAAGHLTDYVVSRATAADVAGSLQRADLLLEQAVFAGYMEPVVEDVKGKPRQRWKIVEDPDFIHMRTEEEITWERQRKRDNSRPSLIIPVRMRDGDGCRYCGQVVKFKARNGRLAGTYDHRSPGKAAQSPDDLVVACKACNSGRKNNPTAEKDYPLLPPPEKPYYSQDTCDFIAGSEWARSNGIEPPPPPRTRVEPGHVPPGHHQPTPTQEPPEPPSAETSRPRQNSADIVTSGSDAPGRDGSGRAGSGRGGSPARPPQEPSRQNKHEHTNTRPSHDPKTKGRSRGRRRGKRGGK